ncbi:unnamed protein product (macronuclear) [Paramecium tetraurelia]|uniref:ENTH domain-containing protein n=1 Tax=Paramecium tetraurelia TaxID=5888 RepID=A0BHX5_PARTE|nr:uncharacterized protein GSPATT00029178001 [Paramecium tetraurelia]CAK58142.1 unnamed protein product [Paramecium tetraurelia]|eukprot:XP_001425540.1 hypothetical protein (macronuclear) [Paramecium tetraurelia strain d4-2]
MIKRFKKLFQGQSEFQSFLTKSSLTKDNFVYKQEDVEILIPYLTEDQNIIEFFQVYQEETCQLYTIKMKMLITIHQMLNISDEFATYFTKINFAYFNKPSYKPETFVFKQVTNEVWLLENLQIPFLQYLQKLALNVQEIKSYRNHHFRKPIHQSNLVVECFKLQNLVNQGLSLVPQLKTSLSNFPHDFLLKKLASNLYCELRQFQRQLINSLSALLDTNSRASNIEIFEFFREVQIIEKKTMSYYMLHKLFDPGRKLMPPLQLKIDLKSAKHLEQQALNEQLKINQQKQMRSQRNSRSNSLDQQQRVSQGFISQRERRFMMYSRTKKQDTIQEDIEMPTEEQQPSEKKKITQMMDNQVNDIPKQFDNLENDNIDIQKKESSDESEINERNSQKETNDIVKNQESTSQADQDENQYI